MDQDMKPDIQVRKRWRWWQSGIVGITGALGLLVAGAWGGWYLRSQSSMDPALVTFEGDLGYITLISPAESSVRANNGINGRKVDFLPNSDMNVLDPGERFLFTSHESTTEAGITRIDLETGETSIILSFRNGDFISLDGLVWTPWDTLLVGEERAGGRVFEVLEPFIDSGPSPYVELTAFGRRRHEGLAIDNRGYLYGVDEVSGGGIYRFRPDAPLAPGGFGSGTLEVLAVDGDVGKLDGSRLSGTWEPAASGQHTGFNRPEDIEIMGTVLYVALTGSNEVISIDLRDPEAPTVGLFVSAGTNAQDLTAPDNLASDPDGNIYIAEDVTLARFRDVRNQLWHATASEDPLAPARGVELVATLGTSRDEFSGVLVDSAGERLFLNILGPDNSILMALLP